MDKSVNNKNKNSVILEEVTSKSQQTIDENSELNFRF